MKRIIFGIGRALGTAGRATIALIGICTVGAALANYAMTQGSGTTFGSIVVSTVHYAQMLVCDPTTPSQCGTVSAAGAQKVDASATTQPISAASLPLPSGAATAANQSTEIGSLGTIATNSGLPLPAQSTHTVDIGGTDQLSAYPAGAVPITASNTGTTAATTATLSATTGKTTFICGYSIRANATAATTVTNTITGVITATLSSVMWVAPAASGLGVDEQIFNPCIPASGTNQAIAIVSGAPGTGGTVSSKGWGYQQ
jgi:hypothetical protein